jgi:hypothetical protein
MRSLTLVLLSLALLFTPLAAAQAPIPAPAPFYTVEILNAPAAFTGLDTTNATSTAPFQVVLTIGNVVCAAAVAIPVTITATAAGAPAFFSATVEPAVINITIAEGPHGSPPAGAPGGGTGDAMTRATIAGNITTNASVQLTLVATAPAPPAPPTGCQGAGSISAASSAPVVVFANMTAQALPPAPPALEEDTPGIGTLVVVVAAIGVALASRKRRE